MTRRINTRLERIEYGPRVCTVHKLALSLLLLLGATTKADKLLYTEGNVKRHEEGPEEEENTTPCEPQARACGQRHQVGGKKGRRYGAREDEIVVVDVKAA